MSHDHCPTNTAPANLAEPRPPAHTHRPAPVRRCNGRPLSEPAVALNVAASRGLRAGAATVAPSDRKEHASLGAPSPRWLAIRRPPLTRGPIASASLPTARPQSRELRP